MSNYPDDIRSFDADPRSPFYNNWRERYEESLAEEIAEDNETLVDAFFWFNPKETIEAVIERFCLKTGRSEDDLNLFDVLDQDDINELASKWATYKIETEGYPEPDEDETRVNRFVRRCRRPR